MTAWMAHLQPASVAALHLNMIIVDAEDVKPSSDAEKAWATRRAELAKHESGYSIEQGTRRRLASR